MRRTVWTTVAGCLAAVSLASIAFYLFSRPNIVRIAVTQDSVDHRILATAAKFLLRDRSDIRFRLITTQNPAAAAKSLESGAVDMAIVRTDLGTPLNGKAVAIMRNSSTLLMAPPGSRLASVADLRGKRIGIVADEPLGAGDKGLLKTILLQYDVPGDDVTLLGLTLGQLATALKTRRIDAVFAVGEPAAGGLTDIVNLVSGAGHNEPVFLTIRQAPAIAQISPALSSAKIVAGAFGGSKPRPQTGLETIAVTTLLMADAKLDDGLVNSVARAIFSLKPKIAASIPTALRIEAPSTNKDAALSAHPGAAAYINGEDVSLIYRYSDFIYLGAMVLSMIGSAIAAVVSRANSWARRRHAELLDRLLELLKQVRMADNPSMLKLAQIEVDGILAEALSNGGKALDADLTSALGLAINQVREAIRDKWTEFAMAAPQTSGASGLSSSQAARPRQLRSVKPRARVA